MAKDIDLGEFQLGCSGGLDAFLSQAEAPRKAHGLRLSSLQQLKGFVRVAEDTLIHQATNDLWAIRKDGEAFVIERLFDGAPLKESQ